MNRLTQEIPKRSIVCCGCQIALNRGMEIVSVLMEDAPYRADYCIQCCGAAPKEMPRWRSRIPQRVKSLYADLKREERAFALFRDLLKEPANRWGEIFILAQYLEREKVLVLRQDRVSMQGIPVSIYEIIETEEMVKVPRLDPKMLPLAEIQASLAGQLK